MATYKPGTVYGRIHGKNGASVGSTYRGIAVVKALPEKSSKPATLAQLTQQSKFGLVVSFLSSINEHLKIGYQSKTGKVSAFNAAVQYHLLEAVTGTYPDFTLDYAKVKLSIGDPDMRAAYQHEVITEADGLITVTWELDSAGSKYTLGTDKAILVVYNSAKDSFLTKAENATRADLQDEMVTPRIFRGDTLHGWLFFVSADGKLVSNTSYLGSFVVPA
jgi:hypothetical protein